MKYKLEDISLKISKGSTPRGKVNYSSDENNLFLRVTDLSELQHIETAEYTLSDDDIKKNKMKIWPSNTVLVSIEGTVGKVAMLKKPMAFNQAIAGIIPDEEKVIPEYLMYYLRQTPTISSILKGTIMPALRLGDLSSIELDLPDLRTQQKIVRILSALDQKIELNNQQSKVLETAAFTLYDDLINSIDESNFKKVSIGQIADCKLGGTPSRAKTEYWGGSINWINSGAINSFRITGPSELITEEGFKHTSTYMLPKGTTVLAITGATLGQVSRMEIEGCANQSVIGIVGNNVISNEYIYLTIVRNIQEIINRQTGGAQQHINKNDIKEFEIILPNQQLMNIFTNKVRPIFEKIAQNEFENKALSSLRDAILPELMSGEINLEKVEV